MPQWKKRATWREKVASLIDPERALCQELADEKPADQLEQRTKAKAADPTDKQVPLESRGPV